MTATLLHPTLTARIETISRKYGPVAEDVKAHVTLALVEKLQDPHFAAQQVGYQIKYAKWEAQKFQQKAARYNRYVEDEPQITDEFSGEEVSAIDEIIPGDVSAEEHVIRQETIIAVRRAVLALTPQQRQVASLLGQGFKPSEVAERLGLSRSNVSHIADRMRAALKEVL